MTITKPKSARLFTSIIVAPFTQFKFGLYMIVISSFFMILTGVLLVQSFWEQYQQVMGIFNIVDPHLKWELLTNDVFKASLWRVGICFLVYTLVMFYVVFKLTHRYYGPLVSIERFVSELIEGNYRSRVTIRSKDELQTLAKMLNHLAEKLEKKNHKGKH